MHYNAQYLEIYGCLCSHNLLYYYSFRSYNYLLNFGIVALHEVNPRVIVRFTLKNTRNNRKHTWTQLIAGATLDELFQNVFEVVEDNKLEVW